MAEKTKYLYGASVQGIQNFIFQTNELKDIVGASEMVEQICTSKFAELIGKKLEDLESDSNAVLFAAGNIKYIFESKSQCEALVRIFPKEIVTFAPGVTISQAVVEIINDDFSTAVQALEQKLRIQRNKSIRSSTIGLMGIKRSRNTGLPVLENSKDEFLDEGTYLKRYLPGEDKPKRTTKILCEKAFNVKNISSSKLAFNISEITGKNDWIAVIHADGNGVGQIVQKIGSNEKIFKKFSKLLDKATTEAAVAAFQAVEHNFVDEKIIPIRPVVLGGDDLTIICRADIALDYTTNFIKQFEIATQKYLGDIITENAVFAKGDVKDRLTACAGIAYIKSSYPFYYGYNLAEELCKAAKKDAKNKETITKGEELPQSCLMFHKVQDSFTENYNEIAKRELQPNNDISFQFGPYYTSEKSNRWTVETLNEYVNKLIGKEGNAIKSHLRNWMSLLHTNTEMAEQKLARLKSITSKNGKRLVNELTKSNLQGDKDTQIYYPVYDVLTIHTINNQETKSNDKEEQQ